MSTLTKVFVVLVVLASFGLLGMTSTLYTYRVEYKKELNKKIDELKKTKEEADALKGKLEKDITDLKTELGSVNTMKAGVEAEKKSLETQNTELHKRLAQLDTSVGDMKVSIDKLKTELATLTATNQKLSNEKDQYAEAKERAESERDIAQSKLNEVEGQLVTASGRLAEQVDAISGMSRQLEMYKKMASKLPQGAIDLEAIDVSSQVEGRVMAISARTDLNLMIINIGRNKGLAPGTQLTVFRGDKFITKVQVEKVEGDWASARSLRDFEKEPAQVGDSVSSRVY